jgi:hypothetical protein
MEARTAFSCQLHEPCTEALADAPRLLKLTFSETIRRSDSSNGLHYVREHFGSDFHSLFPMSVCGTGNGDWAVEALSITHPALPTSVCETNERFSIALLADDRLLAWHNVPKGTFGQLTRSGAVDGHDHSLILMLDYIHVITCLSRLPADLVGLTNQGIEFAVTTHGVAQR